MSTLVVNGMAIDVSSRYDPQLDNSFADHVGAGGNGYVCQGVAVSKTGGGYGGSYGGRGGDGGGVLMATDGGIAASPLRALPPFLQGGCRGGDGSACGAPGAGAGGSGGGAVALVAEEIELDMVINASGAGGLGGTVGVRSGGGGGGSGGMILLDAPLIVASGNALLFANGGGGGQGASVSQGGHRGTASVEPDLAGGGADRPMGRIRWAARGSSGTMLNGQSTPFTGPIGGGGAGFIYAPGSQPDPTIVAPPVTGS